MKTRFKSASALTILVLAATVSRAASINPATNPQVAPMTAQEKKNLDFVLQWWREVIYAGHVELAPKYQAETYIQHNPSINTGRAAFVEYFGKLRQPINPIPATMPNMPVVMGAKGDFVWLIFEREERIRATPPTRITTIRSTFFASKTARCRSTGIALERTPTSPAVQTGVSPKPPSEWNTDKLSAEEKKTLDTGNEVSWRRSIATL